MNKKTCKTIDEYIALFPKDIQNKLQEIRLIIRKSSPGAEEIINYQIPTFRYYGNLVHFAAYQKHIGFYPTSSAIAKFKNGLKEYKTSKGTIQFEVDKKIPVKLIENIVKFRVEEVNKKIKR
jgi:uncharacterized protein YdhG (YjbR/CyaY superfamily)